MYLTPDNVHKYYGKTLDAKHRILGAYPYTVGKWPNGEYMVKDRAGVCMRIDKDPFNQVIFDIVDGEPCEEGAEQK